MAIGAVVPLSVEIPCAVARPSALEYRERKLFLLLSVRRREVCYFRDGEVLGLSISPFRRAVLFPAVGRGVGVRVELSKDLEGGDACCCWGGGGVDWFGFVLREGGGRDCGEWWTCGIGR